MRFEPWSMELIESMTGFELDEWQRSTVEAAFEAYRRGERLQLNVPTRRAGVELIQAARNGSSEALFDVGLIAAQLDPIAGVQRIVAQHADELAQLGVKP